MKTTSMYSKNYTENYKLIDNSDGEEVITWKRST